MKKMIDQHKDIVNDMLLGYTRAYPGRVALRGGSLLCRRTPKEQGKVGVIIGNGTGHEPAMIDLVGQGLFDVNVCGEIFTAPTPHAILEGIKLADRGAGVLVLVSAHQGDILNAKMALIMAKAEGLHAKMVVLYDDIASAPPERRDERRGTAGLFFCFKTVCAAAERGASLDECIRIAEKTRDSLSTLTAALAPGTHPVTGQKSFELPEDEIEVGIGVHGEAGAERIKLPTAKELTGYMLGRLLADRPVAPGQRVMLLLNSCGATTRMELLIIYKNITEYLNTRGVEIARSWVGTYVTTQEMAGFSISLCLCDDELAELYDEYADSPLFDRPF